jgi:ferrous iron transport protein A
MPTLSDLRFGQVATIRSIHGEPALVQRLCEMGLLEGESVTLLAVAPLGDPIEILCGANRLSLRRREAASVQVEMLPSAAS